MFRPEFVLIPVLMLADYWLTLAAARLYGADPAGRAAYELNPRYRGAVAAQRPMPRAVMLRAAGMLLVLAALNAVAHSPAGRAVYEAAIGLLIAVYTLIDGTHIGHILTLRQRNRSPGPASERRRQFAAAFRWFGAAFLPLAALAAFNPGPFSLGAALGGLYLTAMHLRWGMAGAATPAQPAPAAPAACGFCGRKAAEVPTLIAGKGVSICSNCVDSCATLLAERAAAPQ